MVSNASEDFPEPLTPVMIASLPAGRVTSTFLRLCVRAPRTMSGLRAFGVCVGGGVAVFEVDTVTNSSGSVNRHRTTGHGFAQSPPRLLPPTHRATEALRPP